MTLTPSKKIRFGTEVKCYADKEIIDIKSPMTKTNQKINSTSPNLKLNPLTFYIPFETSREI
jgi:hypothetical protein